MKPFPLPFFFFLYNEIYYTCFKTKNIHLTKFFDKDRLYAKLIINTKRQHMFIRKTLSSLFTYFYFFSSITWGTYILSTGYPPPFFWTSHIIFFSLSLFYLLLTALSCFPLCLKYFYRLSKSLLMSGNNNYVIYTYYIMETILTITS